MTQILDLHRVSFPEATRPLVPTPTVPTMHSLRARHRRRARAGVRIFEVGKLLESRRRADEAARLEALDLEADAARSRVAAQAEVDAAWQRLTDNEPGAVMEALAEAFEDNEAMAAPLGVGGRGASVVVQVPDPELIPERMPGVTDAGNLSLRKMTKRQKNDLYAHMVCGCTVVTVKEAFAVCPGLETVTAVAVRRAAPDVYGRRAPEAVLAARFSRASLEGIHWADANAVEIVNEASNDRLFHQKGASAELQPLDARGNPDIANALEAIDLDDADD
ncbi:hypothetical protein OO014_17450 [Intrasporangium calvum]|uniref:Uncharacterized protein n=1 Tax=Intrasporangium calvum TaxID=53358 RepID=A0ABT5GME5_9MICO|nr:hypothetical protein [Intrasporangium calvum]MDC5699040.1 hypothetical protein [Intrasporangium calvum]